MGNTADSAKFRGLVQALAQSPLKELNETLVKSEWFNSQLDSVEDFLSKFTLIDAKDMIENGNAQFLVDESLSVLYKSKTACWTLTRVLPGFYAYECPLKNPDLIAHSLLTLLTTEGICFETPKENHEIIPWARFDDGDEGKLKDEGHLDINRIECLRLLVVALSEPLFSRGITQGEVSKSINQTGSYEEASEQYHSFLYSLFACVVNEETGIKTWWTNSRKELGIHCLNALCALSDETKENKVYLAFRDLRPDNRSKIFSWLIKTIREENCDGIPALTLFFRLLDGNNGECADDVFSEELASLVLSLSCSIWNNRKNRLKTSSVQLCSVLLLSLSSLRQTGIVLNRTLINEDHHCLPKDFPTISSEWTYVDVLVMTICKFIGDGDHEIYSPLQRLSLTSLTNISWYIKSLTPTSCNSIISLLEACSKPKFVFGGEDHPIYLSSLLEIVNNMLQYQGQGHANLLYAILRSKHIFYSIDQLEVPKVNHVLFVTF